MNYEKTELLEYNNVYYYGQNCMKKHQKLGDFCKSDGSYNWVVGDHIDYRYELVGQLGEGSFGEVFKCIDHKNKVNVAVKMVKDNQKYKEQSKNELKILKSIRLKDPENLKNCVHLKETF